MNERFCTVGGVELCYESFGDPDDPALVLVMGLGTQMIAWQEDFCGELARRGFHVIRFDNRDVGRSSRVRARPPTILELIRRDARAATYSLADMADDVVGLLDHLGIERAHVVGASMGGMIAQTIAARHPDRVLSLASIMSNTGHRLQGQPAISLYPLFMRRPPRTREEFVERTVAVFRRVGSPGFPRDESELRRMLEHSFERGRDKGGTARQLAAIFAAGNRTTHLGRIKAPTVVIHGTHDRLVSPSGGRATARAIPGARLVMIRGMGHDLPRGAWPQIIGAIVDNAARAGEDVAAAA